MKCEHCGKNEATFYYKSNINGEVTEQHLCSDCAKELGYADSLEKQLAGFHSLSRSMLAGFDDFFAPVPALAGDMFEPFEHVFDSFDRMMFPQLGAAAESNVQSDPAPAQSASGNNLVSDEEHRKLDRERQINALRYEMQEAIKTENFERAATLRDQIHGLEQQA